MLTRLKVDGFKNLDGVDVRFGAFTCIAGSNGVGKSNLFDAIAFLSALADEPLEEAAAAVRGSEGRVGDVRSLFRSAGGDRAKKMSFLAEMIVPTSGTDDLGSEARASMTFLRYELRLRHRERRPARCLKRWRFRFVLSRCERRSRLDPKDRLVVHRRVSPHPVGASRGYLREAA